MVTPSPAQRRHPICSLIDRIVKVSAGLGVDLVGYTQLDNERLWTLPQAFVSKLEQDLKGLYHILSSVDPSLDHRQREISMLRIGMQSLGFETDPQFVTSIKKGDVVEIYDHKEGIQLYRNLEFMKHSSYSLATVCTVPWPDLFCRSKLITEAILQQSTKVAEEENCMQKWQVEDHLLKETFGMADQVFLMKLNYVAPVFDGLSGARVGWASTIKVTPLKSSQKDVKTLHWQ